MGTYVRYPCAHTTKKPLPTVGGFLERLVKRDANPTLHVKQAKYAAKSWCLSILSRCGLRSLRRELIHPCLDVGVAPPGAAGIEPDRFRESGRFVFCEFPDGANTESALGGDLLYVDHQHPCGDDGIFLLTFSHICGSSQCCRFAVEQLVSVVRPCRRIARPFALSDAASHRTP